MDILSINHYYYYCVVYINYVVNVFTVNASSYDLYTSNCNNLNILRYDVLFILRLINLIWCFIHIHNTALSWTPCGLIGFSHVRFKLHNCNVQRLNKIIVRYFEMSAFLYLQSLLLQYLSKSTRNIIFKRACDCRQNNAKTI